MTTPPIQTPNIPHDRLEQLRQLFPEAFSEGELNLEALRTALGPIHETGPERYNFTWAGKRNAIRLLQTPTRATLIPCPEESIAFQTTRNLFIEGDNLEVLKLLYNTYFGRVKMIYIDPPYNTGNDFVYPDNYTDPLQTYLRLTGQVDQQGNRTSTNSETSGRYHSAWLSMMYPRLFLARQLLRDDGVIFVSIDDNEVHNLRMLMNEVFGEENFVACIIWKKRSTPPNDKVIGAQHEYILVFSKNIQLIQIILRDRNPQQIERYKNPDNHPKGPWMPGDLMANVKGGRFVSSLYFPIVNPNTGEKHYPGNNGNWRFNQETIEKLILNNEIYFGEDGKGKPKLKRFLSDVKSGITWTTLWDFAPLNTSGSKEMETIFGSSIIFESPKPSGLIKNLLNLGSLPSDIVLDFFSGSCTTAHAVLQQNLEDGGNRQFIMVQLPEPTPPDSPARQAGYATIAEIGKERIRRVIRKIQAEQNSQLPPTPNTPQDLGFRVYKLAPSHFAPWVGVSQSTPAAYLEQLELQRDPLLPGWTIPGLLSELAIKHGLSPTHQTTTLPNTGPQTIHQLSDPETGRTILVCLDPTLPLSALSNLPLNSQTTFICRDIALTDETAANLALQCRLESI